MLVAVVYVALAFGPVTGLLAGVVGGLTQDALAGGIVGIGGLAKTLIGFAVGVLGAQFIVSQTLPRFVMFVAATFLHEVMFQGLHALIESRPLALHYSAVLVQAVVNGVRRRVRLLDRRERSEDPRGGARDSGVQQAEILIAGAVRGVQRVSNPNVTTQWQPIFFPTIAGVWRPV